MTPSDEEVRALAREILASDPYAAWREEPGLAWRALAALGRALRDGASVAGESLPAGWQEALRGLWERIQDGAEGLLQGATGDPWVRTVLLVLLGAVLVFLAVQVALALRAAGALPASQAARPGRRRAEPLAARARGLAAQGRHLEAAHLLALAALEHLLARRFVELAPSEPNRTLRRRVQESGLPDDVRRDFLALLDRLEEHWFRDRRGDRELYDAWRRLHDRLDALPEAA